MHKKHTYVLHNKLFKILVNNWCKNSSFLLLKGQLHSEFVHIAEIETTSNPWNNRIFRHQFTNGHFHSALFNALHWPLIPNNHFNWQRWKSTLRYRSSFLTKDWLVEFNQYNCIPTHIHPFYRLLESKEKKNEKKLTESVLAIKISIIYHLYSCKKTGRENRAANGKRSIGFASFSFSFFNSTTEFTRPICNACS